ncbi:plasmalemma vesicle associated protein a [Micropterus salmoides]|uniref:plasmalemma vesicle associated protein a n=1 Tax=Micropterus salmoides TaxID=27706 RepID=UPI0018ED3FB9|nr:plasmalemma vesicle associated protein a [Micropterus salmoides]
MYSSGYSEVSKYSSEARKKMQHRSKGKSCGYYMRIVFFFSSLIQFLIIVSLVLFLIYGKKQDSACTSRIQDLEESFSRLSIENVALKQQRKNLTNLLNVTLTEKARNDWDLAVTRNYLNISLIIIKEREGRLQQCYSELTMSKNTARFYGPCQTQTGCNCGLLAEQLKARLELVESNFTQTRQRMRMEMDQIAKDRDNINLEAISLRRDKSTHEKEVEFYRQKCKDDFAKSLSGVSNVTKAFLQKVDSLFPVHIAFQLTCAKQREHLEQIRTNCTSLSREVEDKFQQYLNSVGEQVSGIQGENSRLKAENWRLSEDYRWCSQNRTGLIQQNKQNLDKLQWKHDEDKERLLMDKMRLNGEIEVLGNNVKYKSKEVEHLTEKLKHLNMSCMSRTGFAGFPGGSNSLAGTHSQPGFSGAFNKPISTGAGSSSSSFLSPGSGSSTGLGFSKPVSTGAGSSSSSFLSPGSGSSTGLGFNKPVSTGAGSSSSSFLSPGSGSSTGLGFNKPVSTGAGSSSSSFLSPGSGSSTGLGFNKPVSTGAGSSSSSFLSPGSGSATGLGFNKPESTGAGSSSSSFLSPGSGSSTGLGFNKPVSTGAGSSSTSLLSTGSGSSTGSGLNKPAFSSFGSAGSNPSLSSSGIGSNKPAVSGRGPSTSGSSSGSTGSTSKSGQNLSPFSWFGNINSGQSKTGSGTGRGTSSGNSNGGTGSSFGAGRTSGPGGGTINIAHYLQDVQRLINPPGPQENQDLSRMLG